MKTQEGGGMIATYDYPCGGGYADTVATLADGRTVNVNTQHKSVLARDGSLDGIDRVALIVDARINGKFGWRPEPRASATELARREADLDDYERGKKMVERAMAGNV